MKWLYNLLGMLSLIVGSTNIVHAGNFVSDAIDSSVGVAHQIGDALTSPQGAAHLLKTLSDNGFNPSTVTNAKVLAAVFDQTTGQISLGGSFSVPGVPNSTCGFRIKYNPDTQSFDGSELEVDGKSIPFDPKNLDATLDWAIQHAFDWIPNFGIAERVIESDYDDIFSRLEAEHGAGNVYLASEQFVSWACPTTVGKDVLKEILSAGSATDVIIDGVKEQAKKELDKVGEWLKKKASGIDPVVVATKILQGDRPETLVPSLSLRWQNVQYKSHVRILTKDIGQTEIPETHWGFMLVWHDANTTVGFTRLPTTDTYTPRNADLQPLDIKWSLGVRVQYTTLGCRIVVMDANSAASKAGLVLGDTISSIDGSPVGNINKMHWVLWRVLNKTQTGRVRLVVRSADGAVRTLDVTADKLH
ncbi:MAG: hypothetical protein JWP89_2718 [Schlesneria sp.]|nr:hypothetical protein [Schlesneria sp.]